MPAEWFRKYPTTVRLPDGRVFYNALVLHLGDDLGVFATRVHYPDGEATASPRIVRLASFPGSKVRPVERDRWAISTEDGDVAVESDGRCACSDPLKTWRP